MKTVRDYDFTGKKALIRVDFNVPFDEHFNVTDDTRIRLSMPTIELILKKGGSVILMSHLGRPKKGPEAAFSLKHIIPTLEKALGKKVKFADDCVGAQATELAASLKAGEVLVLENLRFYKEEEAGDEAFAKKLAELGDCYVNDAFGTAHRAHASTTIVAKFFPKDKMFGLLLAGELESIDKALKTGKAPLTAIMGGSKVSSKISIIMQLLDKVDVLIIGGGMGYTFAKAQGGNVGTSKVEEDYLQTALDVIKKAKEKGVKLFLPVDCITADDFSNDAKTGVSPNNNIPEGLMGLDVGPETNKIFSAAIENAGTILWNGPVGVFEMEKFEKGTVSVADAIVKATAKGAFSLIGGGDSVAAINKYHLADKVSYISTGGGAMLEYLEGQVLPGVEAILN
ncbi:MAG: phosphoglycerate kinase [Bacteroidetes bacterium]|nr:phosphoglycerate kinase [Bacteroidota bacterium]